MSTRRNGISRHQRVENSRGEGGPNWILIAGGALLSTLSIRFGYKLKQSVDSKPHLDATGGLKRTCITSLLLHEDLGFSFSILLDGCCAANGTSDRGRCCLHSGSSSCERNKDCCFHTTPG